VTDRSAFPESAGVAPDWLPEDKRAAVCLTIDDIHPGGSADAYEAGGDLQAGGLGQLAWLLDRHPQLRVTLFVTPAWRLILPWPTRGWLGHVPFFGRHAYWAPVLPREAMRLDRHPAFIAYLTTIPRAEYAPHGLHHVHRGPQLATEFQQQDAAECASMLREARDIFARAGLEQAPGFQPPAWALPPALIEALDDVGFSFVCSARDVQTPIGAQACAAMSGIRGVSLIYPQWLRAQRLVHYTTNFQATSCRDRAHAIIDQGGLLLIKAHIAKHMGNHVQLDGLDDLYRNYLDALLYELEQRYGAALWWTSLAQITARLLGTASGGAHGP
jgi:predicted deacetylase